MYCPTIDTFVKHTIMNSQFQVASSDRESNVDSLEITITEHQKDKICPPKPQKIKAQPRIINLNQTTRNQVKRKLF